MEQKEIICTVCPMGCRIQVSGDVAGIQSVTGYTCKRGEAYARTEFSHPVRILTSVVKLQSADAPLLAVRSNGAIPKELQFRCMEEIKKVTVKPPVACKDVIIGNILGTGIDIVATGTAD